jgi:hypothetical protein
MNEPFPATKDKQVRMGFLRLLELAHLGLEQIANIRDPAKQTVAVGILDEIDGLVVQIARLVPEISPVTRWFQCEKLRIGPGSMDEVMASTRAVFEKLAEVCQIYQINQTFNESMNREDLTWKS